MIKFTINKAPNQDACLLQFVTGTYVDADTNTGFNDVSFLWAQNRAGIDGMIRTVNHDGPRDVFGTADILVTDICAVRRDLIRPAPLFWRHLIGSNTLLGKSRKYVFSPTTDALPVSTAVERRRAMTELRNNIKLLEADGSESDIVWDLNADSINTANIKETLGANTGWNVHIYLEDAPTRDRPLFIQYTAVDAAGVYTNYVELLNVEEPLVSDGIEEFPWPPVSNDYVIVKNDDNTFTLDAPGRPCYSVALWTDQAGWTIDESGTDVEFELNTVLQFTVDRAGKTVREWVSEVNAQGFPIKATVLSDHQDAVDIFIPATTTPINSFGTVLFLGWHLIIKQLYSTKFFCKTPKQRLRQEEWRPEMRIGHVHYEETSGPLTGALLTYDIPEVDWVSRNPLVASADKKYVYKDPVDIVRPDVLALNYTRVNIESLILEVNNQNGNYLIEDYDARSGLLKLTKPIESSDSITASYEHDLDGWYEIDSIDLNPIEKHFPGAYRYFVGIYITPSQIEDTPSGPDPLVLKPVVGWAAAANIGDLQAAVDGIMDPTGSYPISARLIGIYQISSQQDVHDIKILDIRSYGGGLKHDVDMDQIVKHAPESQFYSDIGYWDGEPYPGTGVVVVQGPAALLGNNTTAPGTPSPPDGDFINMTGKHRPDELRRRIHQHTVVGTYAILDMDKSHVPTASIIPPGSVALNVIQAPSGVSLIVT